MTQVSKLHQKYITINLFKKTIIKNLFALKKQAYIHLYKYMLLVYIYTMSKNQLAPFPVKPWKLTQPVPKSDFLAKWLPFFVLCKYTLLCVYEYVSIWEHVLLSVWDIDPVKITMCMRHRSHENNYVHGYTFCDCKYVYVQFKKKNYL